jgi:hypothetical protein
MLREAKTRRRRKTNRGRETCAGAASMMGNEQHRSMATGLASYITPDFVRRVAPATLRRVCRRRPRLNFSLPHYGNAAPPGSLVRGGRDVR